MSAARFLRAKVIGVVLLASALVIAIATIVPRGEGAPKADSADVGELTEVATNHFARLATIMVEGRNVAQNSYDFCEVDSIEPKVNGVLSVIPGPISYHTEAESLPGRRLRWPCRARSRTTWARR